jgi:3-isopropylmalate/(R)-2-methylmalate dehydratase small subunit
MKVSGTAWKFAQDDINTDLIRLETYSHLPLAEQAQHCLETLDPTFASKAQRGDIIVGGRNFGCGSSRPAHAALLALGIGAVIAESFGRIFFRSSISDSLLVAPCPGIVGFVDTGDRIEIDVVAGQVRNLTRGTVLDCPPLPAVLREVVECGGEKGWIKSRLAREAQAAGIGGASI